MARPSKAKALAAAAPAEGPSAVPQRTIDVEGFIRVRDSVYARLATIQNLIQSFSVDYLRQTNLLLGEGTNIDNPNDVPNFGDFQNLLPANVLVPQPAEEVKKERKKRQHDPNAPKRPLTPYFLYMQTARPIIANDLGADTARGAVQEEGQRRWGTMSQAEKSGWDQAYKYNLRLYNARVHSYKNGNPTAKEMSDEEALQYAEANGVPMPTGPDAAADAGNDQEAIAQQLGAAVAEEEPEPASPPLSKTPKSTKKGGKRKSAADQMVAPTPVAAPPAPTPTQESGKKRKRQSKVAEEKVEPEPKKSGRGKKAKSG